MLVAVSIIVVALLISSARLLLPYLDTYHQQVEAMISDAVGATVEVSSMEAAWHGAGPLLKLRGVRVLNDGGSELLNFDHGSIGLNLLQSIRYRSLQIGNLVVSGVKLIITRDEAGKISVAGLEAGAAGTGDNGDEALAQRQADNQQALLHWLLIQPRMAIESSEVTWRDLKQGGRELHFSNIAFKLRNQGNRHQLDGAAELPTHFGRTFSFAIDIDGDQQAQQEWRVQGYVEGKGLQLAPWLEEQAPAGVRVDKGLVETRLWFEWRDAALQRVEGDFSLQQLLLTSVGNGDQPAGEQSMNVDLLSGEYAWKRSATGWALSVDHFLLGRESRMWPPSRFSVATSTEADGAQVVEAKLGYIDIDDLNALLQMSDQVDERLRQQLLAFAPTGELREGYLHYWDPSRDNKQDYRYTLSSRFDGVGINAIGKLPGLNGLGGHLRLDNSGGYLALKQMSGEIEIPALFRSPLTVTALAGELYWQSGEGGWRVESRELNVENSDLELSLELALTGGSSTPEIALLATFDAPSVVNISHYLPVGIMPAASVEWLDRAIVGGNASAGQVVFYGPLDHRFPYEESPGLFDIRFNLTDGILDYAPGWPRLEEMEAEVIFAGSGMQINAVAAKILDADVTQVSARIKSFRAHPALLEIDGQAQGHARETLNFLRRSPLNARFGAFTEGAEVTAGRSELDLSLQLPLAKLPVKVNGLVRFEGADFYLADRAVDILDVNGELHFSETGIEVRQAQARLLGMDSVLHAATLPVATGEGSTVIGAVGSAAAADVQRLLPSPPFQRLDGRAAWQALLTIPARGAEKKGLSLRVTSDLKGMAVNFPEPLGKSAQQVKKLVLETVFPRRLDVPMTVQYGSQLRGIFDLDGKMTLQRGTLTFGGAQPSMPTQRLIRIDGKLKRLSLAEWLPLIAAAKRDTDSRRAAVGVGELNLEIEQLLAFERNFHYTTLALALESKGGASLWRGDISSHLMGGVLQIPVDFEQEPLVMALDYLILPPPQVTDQPSTSSDDVNPKSLPAMKINSRYFSYADLPLGSLKLQTTRRPAGVHIKQLTLLSPLMVLTMSGDWTTTNSAQHSIFNITINSDDLGEMLSTFDIADSIRGGQSEIGIIARWPGAPGAFALERLSGNMHLKVKKGRLLEVEPGAGRIFGLISLQSIPRRLTLDFSDMFKKGFSFDRMEGDFEINNGDATTSNFSVVGPSATISMSGRVGLATKDYDQDVIVEPHVASSLPVVGAVVGSLGIGAAILLAQKLLNLNEVTQVRYSVKGSWDDPVVTREKMSVPDSGGEIQEK